jgi:hypothetical protein
MQVKCISAGHASQPDAEKPYAIQRFDVLRVFANAVCKPHEQRATIGDSAREARRAAYLTGAPAYISVRITSTPGGFSGFRSQGGCSLLIPSAGA